MHAVPAMAKANLKENSVSPTAETAINTQDYVSASGTVENFGDDLLALYDNQIISYDLEISQEDAYFITLSSAQVLSLDAPSEDYTFSIDVFLDGSYLDTYELSSSREFTESGLIDLGLLTGGTHTFSFEWTNDLMLEGVYDANLGLKNLLLLR